MGPEIVSTIPFTSRYGSAVDPLAAEITWKAWEVAAADPSRLTPEVAAAINGGFDTLLEAAWHPGRSVVVSEAEWLPATGEGEGHLAVRLAVGVLGTAGSTAFEMGGLVGRVEQTVRREHVFAARAVDPAVVIRACASGAEVDAAGHMIHVRQRYVAIGDQDIVEVVSRFTPTIEPWASVVSLLAAFDRHARVRATMLSTALSPADRLEIERDIVQVRGLRDRNNGRGDVGYEADRAEATLLDLRASLGSPIFAGEIAIWSAEPLPFTAARSFAAAFTAESEVLRQPGHIVVASNKLLLGGFDVVHAPRGWEVAQHYGVPLRGGIRERALVDLLTLSESPIGWPLPYHGPLPATPSRVPVPRRAPSVLRCPAGPAASFLGLSVDGDELCMPLHLRTRHRALTGTTGVGKSIVMRAQAIDDLRHGRPFLFVDPHGSAADDLVAHAEWLGVRSVVIDPGDGATAQIRVLPACVPSKLDERDRAIRRLADAVASSLLNAEWAGPRWFSVFTALLELVSVHGGELVDGFVWMNDVSQLRVRLEHPGLSAYCRSTLSNVALGSQDEVRGWVASKLVSVVSGSARRIIAAVGSGVDLGATVAEGRPVIVNLASLSTHEANLIGHLALSAVLDVLFERVDPARPIVTCYIDEAHRFPAFGIERAIAEGRKFGVALDLAVQSLGQLPVELADIATGAGTHLAFRATPDTAARLAPVLGVSPYELVSQPDLHAVVGVRGHEAASVVVPVPEPCPVPRSRHKPTPLPLAISELDTEPDNCDELLGADARAVR